jgi:hypothetical protein
MKLGGRPLALSETTSFLPIGGARGPWRPARALRLFFSWGRPLGAAVRPGHLPGRGTVSPGLAGHPPTALGAPVGTMDALGGGGGGIVGGAPRSPSLEADRARAPMAMDSHGAPAVGPARPRPPSPEIPEIRPGLDAPAARPSGPPAEPSAPPPPGGAQTEEKIGERATLSARPRATKALDRRGGVRWPFPGPPSNSHPGKSKLLPEEPEKGRAGPQIRATLPAGRRGAAAASLERGTGPGGRRPNPSRVGGGPPTPRPPPLINIPVPEAPIPRPPPLRPVGNRAAAKLPLRRFPPPWMPPSVEPEKKNPSAHQIGNTGRRRCADLGATTVLRTESRPLGSGYGPGRGP